MKAVTPIIKIIFEDGTEVTYTGVVSIDENHRVDPIYDGFHTVALQNLGYAVTFYARRRKVQNGKETT